MLSILCHVQSSIVCYCLYSIWIVVSQLFIRDVEAWLIQILIFEVKHCIWALILLKVEIVVICQFLLKILVSHINFHIKSPYIVKLLQCWCLGVSQVVEGWSKMSVHLWLVSEILFVYLWPIFLFCFACHDQQLVHHIHNGLILIILTLFLSLFTDPFLSLQLNVLASPALHTHVALYGTYLISNFSPQSYMWLVAVHLT